MTAPARRRVALAIDKLWPVIGLCVLLVAIVVLTTAFGTEGLQRAVTDSLIKLLAVIGLYIFIGNTGVFSFGHISFMAIGAYVSAWLTMDPGIKRMRLRALPDFVAQAQLPEIPALLLAGLSASVFALIVGIPLMRLRGISASIGTFAVLAIVVAVFGNWTQLTGGRSSLIGVPVYSTPWIVLAWVLVAVVVAFVYQQSRFGLMARASRDDDVAANTSGVDIFKQRLGAFVLSAFFVGVAGALYGHLLGILTITTFYLSMSFITLAMLVIGGVHSLSGAVIGVVVVSSIIEVMRHLEKGFSIGGLAVPARPGIAEVVLALVMLVVLILRPSGIMGGREIRLPRFVWRLLR